METGVNTRQSHVIYLLDDVITATRHKSQEFNFSLHVKINHI